MKAILDYFGIGITEIILFVLITAGVFYLDHILKKKRQLEWEREQKREREHERDQEREQKRLANPEEWTQEEKASFYQKSFAKLQQIYNGRIKSELNEDEYGSIELRTMVLNRPINILLDAYDGDGSTELYMKFINRRETLSLYYDERKKQSNVHGPKDEHWDEDDELFVHVFAPGVYIQEERDEIQGKIVLVENLKPSLREAMFSYLKDKKASSITISEELIRIHLEQPFISYAISASMQSMQEILDEAFTLMNDIASHFSDGLAPIKNSGSSSRITCTYCGTLYTFDEEDPRCSSCGAISNGA